ncbi:MAG: hypothetical protein MUO72_09585 [Bacteroidales bacterium]|nr:hypothetical protein [Bacteroidales bacterium]
MSEEKIIILNRDSYNFWKENHEPLIYPGFDIEINLRKEIQDELFGSDSANPNNRHKFFLWVWEHRNHVCEESGAFLGYTMQADFMSHILTRGAHIEMWNDPRNINLLTPDNHRKWETGKREKMRIWDKNKVIIAQLKSEYSKLKTYTNFPSPENNDLKAVKCPHCGGTVFVNK